jgi:hypothetical protein
LLLLLSFSAKMTVSPVATAKRVRRVPPPVEREVRPAPGGRLLEDGDDSYTTCNDDDCPTGKERQFYAWVLVLMGGPSARGTPHAPMAVDWLPLISTSKPLIEKHRASTNIFSDQM